LKKTIGIEKIFLPKERVYFALSFLTKGGIGLCGSWTTKRGLRTCVDGLFLEMNEF